MLKHDFVHVYEIIVKCVYTLLAIAQTKDVKLRLVSRLALSMGLSSNIFRQIPPLQGAFHICMQTKSYLWWQIADCSIWLQYRGWDEQLLSTYSCGLSIWLHSV